MEMLRERMTEKLRALCYSTSPTKFSAINDVREVIANVTPILDRVFPNNYDIQFTHIVFSKDVQPNIALYTSKLTIQLDIILKFPEILIKNGSGHKHTIKDLYVKIAVIASSTQSLRYSGLYGARGQVSAAELRLKYAHSHLPSFNSDLGPGAWASFCLGSSMLAMKEMWKLNDPLSFEMMLYNIQDLVEWESLSGVPYIRIDAISRFSGGLRTISEHDYYDIEHVQEQLENKALDHISLKIQENGYIKVISKETLSEELATTMQNVNRHSAYHYIVIKSGDSIISASLLNVVRDNGAEVDRWRTIEFKEETIKPILIKDYEDIDPEGLTKYIHPTIEEYIKQSIEREINFQEIKRGELEQKYPIKVHSKVSEPNQILVSEG
jgi:transcriptional regulator CtsR